MKVQLSTLLIFAIIFSAVFSQDDCKPRIIRLLIGERYSDESSPYTATLMYQTHKECKESGIVFLNGETYLTTASSVHSVWNDTFCHNKKRNCEKVVYDQFIHTIRVAVQPSIQFTYAFCADQQSISGCTDQFTSTMPPLNFNTPKLRTNFLSKKSPNTIESSPLKILFFGDHDLSNAGTITFKSLFKTLETTKFDAFLFLGDYGYEFYQNNGQVGDDYIDTLSKINTAAPMAITAGNHEDNFEFKFFNEKFQMPSFNETENNYYSFNIGNTHFLSLNLHYFNDQVKTPNSLNQQKMISWVENDLKKVDRSVTPWIIVFGHKMLYCKGSDCDVFASDYAQFDSLLNQYQVDLFISGHKHKFQVMKPMKSGQPAKFTQSNSNNSNTISNYEGFVTVIQGNGGTSKIDEDDQETSSRRNLANKNKENYFFTKPFQKQAMLFENENLGYGILNILDNNHINIQSINSSTDKSVYELNLHK